MGVLSRLASIFRDTTGEAGHGPGPERMWVADAGSAISRAGSRVSADSVLQLDVVEGVMVALSGPLSTLPIGIFEPVPDGDGHKEKLRDHPLVALMNLKPNLRQTAQEFWMEMTRHLALRRNCYALIEQDFRSGEIASLTPIHPNRIVNVQMRGGIVFYTVLRTDGGGIDVIDESRIWHLRMPPLTDDGLMGKPVYQTSRDVFGRALGVKDYGDDWFRNSGLTGGLITGKGGFKNQEEKDLFIAAWRANSTGANRHRDKLLEGGLEYKAGPTVQNNDGQFIETDKEAGLAICRLWNMPPHRVGILDRATFSNIEQSALEFIMYTLAPFVGAIEQGVQRDLLFDDGLVVEMNMAGLLRGDILSRYKAYAMGRQWGWLSVNDIRRRENDPPVPGGDTYDRPANMVPIGTPDATNDNGSTDVPNASRTNEP